MARRRMRPAATARSSAYHDSPNAVGARRPATARPPAAPGPAPQVAGACVRATGETYAVDQELRLHNAVDRTLAHGPLHVIGHVEPGPVPEGDRKRCTAPPSSGSGTAGPNVAGRRTD